MQEHNDQCRALVGTDYALVTVRRYESCRRYLAKLIRQRYGKEDLSDEKRTRPDKQTNDTPSGIGLSRNACPSEILRNTAF